ncbi:MAG: GuaB1 family IMP dehydrogenase-related protein [Yaniella sp.]|uniref:GMP reductase n=1 Tax=Yaniella sp. TaxID=2773929 RepID=UPI00264735C5|nr:GuaB1 family IMP dehydrogenase-related protein [Yaniella sp.]MDN6147931.1 GuaB1 family IMP dehydrogenase-related protein [Yaniella sp.]MDN6457070.1 GuaB1 family IMP dehydrogenase-related protein [Yaniella sp.]
MRFLNPVATDLTYSDVFLVPSFSQISSRMDVDISSTDGTGTSIPIVSSNMNGVTGRRMVETMARRGGLGIFPQDTPLHLIQESIDWVKSRDTLFETPLYVGLDDRVLDVRHLAEKRNHPAVCVVDNDRALLGIVHVADTEGIDQFASVQSLLREPLLTVAASELKNLPVEARDKALRNLYMKLHDAQVKFVPVVDGTQLVGALTQNGVLRSTIFSPATDERDQLRVGAAVGVNADVAQHAEALVERGVDVIVVDTAHGHQEKMLSALRSLADLPVPIVAGNIVSADGAHDLLEAGADILKVGVGPGAMCTTRMMTAVGRPQFSAVHECAQAAASHGKHVWADGGIKYPRDVALALAAGASQVMIGSWFAGVMESPGDMFIDLDGRKYKENFGMASARAVSARTRQDDAYARARKAFFEEGVSGSKMYVDPANPSVEDLLDDITAGVRSSMTYAGAHNLREFHERAVVGIQSAAGYDEGRPVATSW